jgi:hypothetical protein
MNEGEFPKSTLPIKRTLTSALAIQNGGQICFANANPTNVKGVVGKSVGTNFRIRTTSPTVIRIFLEIFAFDLRREGFFSFGPFGLLSVRGIDVASAR